MPPRPWLSPRRWAAVFPLSTAATAFVSFAHFVGDAFWWVLATGMLVLATFATLFVVILTVRGIVLGELPASPDSLTLYYKFHWDEYPVQPSDFAAAAPRGGRARRRAARQVVKEVASASGPVDALPV